MKKVLGSLVLAFTLLVSSQVFADPSAQSMKAIQAQEWQKAENSLKEDLKTNRKDIIVWYFRATVLNHLQRPDDALKCLDNVVKLDPSFRPAKVAELRQRLERNSQILAKSKSTGKPVVTASSIEKQQRNTQVVKQTPVSAPPVPNSTRYTDTTVSKPTPSVASTHNQEKSSGGFFTFLLAIILVGGVGFFGYTFFNRKSTDKAKAKFQSDMITKLVDADKKLSNMKEMLELDNKESSYLFKRISSLKDDVILHTRAVKAGNGYNGYEIEQTLSEVDEVELRYNRKDYDAPVSAAPAPTYSQPRETVQASPRRETESYSAPRSTPRQQTRSYSQPRHTPSHSDRGHTTIINNGSNGNDLLTTMAGAALVNEMINHHEPVREREIVREVPVYEDRSEKDDFSFGSSSNNYDDSSKSDDFSLNDSSDYDNNSRSDDFSLSSSDSDSGSYNDSSDDDDFNL